MGKFGKSDGWFVSESVGFKTVAVLGTLIILSSWPLVTVLMLAIWLMFLMSESANQTLFFFSGGWSESGRSSAVVIVIGRQDDASAPTLSGPLMQMKSLMIGRLYHCHCCVARFGTMAGKVFVT